MNRSSISSHVNDLVPVLIVIAALFDPRSEAGTIRLLIDDPHTISSTEPGVDGISADGRYVLFESDRSDLVPGDTNGNGTSFFETGWRQRRRG